jgi:hypothetical protein
MSRAYILWRRVALWSNSSWTARTVFWGGVFAGSWGAAMYTMQLTNRSTFDPKLQRQVARRKTTEQDVQTDTAKANLQRLLDDIKRGDDQKRDWRAR